MKKKIHIIIQFIALAMLVGGIFMFIICKHQAWEAGIGYYTRDKEAVAMWNFLSIQCIVTAISSVFVLGFSYIVEAACKYLEKCETEESQNLTNNEEE